MANWWSGASVVATPIDTALAAEGVTGPKADFVRSIYAQESDSGANTTTSNAGAVGGMQLIPDTFKRVADPGWSITDPIHNARAGVRYAAKVFDLAGGDPALAGAGYYGGEGAIGKARQGVAVSDPRNPTAPNTLQYGQQVAARMPAQASTQDAGNWWAAAPVVNLKPSAAQQVATDAISQGARNFTDSMSTTDKVLAGAGKAGYDLARGAGQLLGIVSRDDVAQSRKQDAPLMNTTAGMVGNVGGNIAFLAPAALIPGANTIAGGAAIGAVTGLLQPSTSTEETLANLGMGAVGGAAVPAISQGGRTLKAAAEPFYEGGRQAIVGRALNRAAGSDAPAVAQRLTEAGQPFTGPSQGTARTVMGEFVPGSVPTVGQAAQNAGVAALERAASATNPEVTNAINKTMQAQNAARVGVVQDMAGADGARLFAGEARDATANQLYGEARRLGVDPAKLTPDALQNIADFSKRVPDAVLNKAKELAQISGTPMTDATSIEGLHWVKMAIDDLIGAADRAGNGTLKRAYVGLQKDLLSGMDNLSPAYQNARKTYQAMSRPINQMDVAQAIGDASVNKLTGNLQPNAFARALSDKTAARATGLPTATLESTMEPAQMNALNSVLLDVQRSNTAQNAGRGAGSDTVQKLAYSNLLDQAGVPTFLRELAPAQVIGNVGGRVADAAYARANRELSNRLAEIMLDPGTAGQLMRNATPKEQSEIMKVLTRSASGLALSTPAAAHAQKKQ